METIIIKDDATLKTSELMQRMRDKFNVWSYYDDARLDTEFPKPKAATERAFLCHQEPDPETLGLSVREAEEKGHTNGITLRERILLELAYFEKTGEHLDVKGITFCSGSRYSDGGVPVMGWDSGDQEVQVRWCSLGYSNSDYGLRSAVSLNPSSSFPSDEVGIENAIQIVKDAGYKVIKEF